MVQGKLLRMEILGRDALQEQLRQKEGQLERHKKTATSYVTEVKLQREREVGMCHCSPVIHSQQSGTSVRRPAPALPACPFTCTCADLPLPLRGNGARRTRVCPRAYWDRSSLLVAIWWLGWG